LEKSKLTLNHQKSWAGAGTIVFHSRLLRLFVVGGGKLYSLVIIATGPKRCVTGSELPDQVVRCLLFCKLHSRKFRETPHIFPSLTGFWALGRDMCLSLSTCQCTHIEMHPFFAGADTLVLSFIAILERLEACTQESPICILHERHGIPQDPLSQPPF
jgi:hypothetical protein